MTTKSHPSSTRIGNDGKNGFTVADMQQKLQALRNDEAHVRAQVCAGCEMNGPQLNTAPSSSPATANVGCGPTAVCVALKRKVLRMLRVQASPAHAANGAVASTDTSAGASSAVACGANGAVEVGTRLFGVGSRSKRVGASQKLEQVSSAMLARAEELRTRAEAQRQLAVRTAACNKQSSRSMALAQLRRAKQLEKQADAAQSAHEAIEAQSDMLQQTALQREVAAALGASTRSLKKDRALLTKAETAVEAAGQIKDIHDELAQTMGELGSDMRVDYDDDELLAELGQMINEASLPASDGQAAASGAAVPVADVGAGADSAAIAAAELRRRHAEYDEAERLRQAIPDAPVSRLRTEERSGLLSQA
jgi:hypothetical protein